MDKNFVKKNLTTILMVGATVVLGGVAVFTAVRLYQLRNQSVAPTSPESQPGATFTSPPTLNACTELAFTITTPTGSPTGSPTSTPTTTSTATPTPKVCNQTCANSSECASGLTCLDKQEGTGSKACRLATNPTSSTCEDRGCNQSCGETSDCESGLTCLDTGGGDRRCRDEDYPSSNTCSATTSTPTSTSTSTATPASLPPAGTATPTLLGIGAGILLLMGALVLAL